jgi:hypothetical protein
MDPHYAGIGSPHNRATEANGDAERFKRQRNAGRGLRAGHGSVGAARRLHGEFHVIPRGHRRDTAHERLPDDRCQCPHWGYVVSGKLTFRFADHDEVFEAGDAFYTPPSHIPVKHEPGSEAVFFSPAEELAKTDAVMMKNMEAMQAAEQR